MTNKNNQQLRNESSQTTFLLKVECIAWIMFAGLAIYVGFNISLWFLLLWPICIVKVMSKVKKHKYLSNSIKRLDLLIDLVNQIDMNDDIKKAQAEQAFAYATKRINNGADPVKSLERLKRDLQPLVKE